MTVVTRQRMTLEMMMKRTRIIMTKSNDKDHNMDNKNNEIANTIAKKATTKCWQQELRIKETNNQLAGMCTGNSIGYMKQQTD